jgi:lipopolysaccharide export system permease protein
MDRYLAMQLISPFLFGVGAFTSVVLAIDSLFELLRKVVESGLPLNIALEIFLLKLPYVMVYSFPMSTLLATLMTYSRLSSESELIALRGCGVSVYRMVLTAVVLSFAVTLTNQINLPLNNRIFIILNIENPKKQMVLKKRSFLDYFMPTNLTVSK